MSLLPDESRNETDIDKIFSYIYADLVSIYPSNDPFRIFLQYFQPLFDLTLGVAYIIEEDIIAASCLLEKQKNGLEGLLKTLKNSWWLNCEHCEPCKELKDSIPHISESKSCLNIPIKVVGCFQKNDTVRDYCSEEKIGSFLLFSRLQPIEDIKEHISRHVKACFLQQTARESFLSNTNNQHNCFFPEKSCNGKGPGPLNKIGEKLCKRRAVKKI